MCLRKATLALHLRFAGIIPADDSRVSEYYIYIGRGGLNESTLLGPPQLRDGRDGRTDTLIFDFSLSSS